MAESDFDLTLEDLERKSVGRLLSAEAFDHEAFSSLLRYLCEKSEKIKGEHVVSKQFVNCTRRAARLIESRAADVTLVRANLHLAGEFSRLLDIVAAGEAWSDYKRGVPRVQ